MTVIAVINRIDAIKPNIYTLSEKIQWLSTLDGIVKKEIIDTHTGVQNTEFTPYNDTDIQRELLIPYPYDEIYVRWLEAQIDYTAGEYEKYNNSISLFNIDFDNFNKYYNRIHKPIRHDFTHF